MTFRLKYGSWVGSVVVAGLLVAQTSVGGASLSAAGSVSDKDDKGGKGEKGDKGDKGDHGDKGQVGPAGPQGPAGPAGPAGTSLTVTPIAPGGPCGSLLAGANISDGSHSVPVCDGAKGDTGDKGEAGAAAPGVTGEAGDYVPPQGVLGMPLTTAFSAGGTTVVAKHVTGFHGYMVWANAALAFQIVNSVASPTQATCAIFQTVNGVSTQLDFRTLNVLLPSGQPQALVRYALGLVSDSGEFNTNDIVTYSLQCGPPPNNSATPVLATSSSLAVVGLNAVFGLDQGN